MFTLQEPYYPRPIRFLELWERAGWRLKVYGIAYQRPAPRPELIDAAKAVVYSHLIDPTALQEGYGVGFLGINDGRGANFVFLDYWANENELHHHVYISPADKPEELIYATPTGIAACVWDLRVMCFERQAWLETVLMNPKKPDLEAYLARQLNEDV
ncbi:MAG: isochorismatase [Anaerolineae bacterium]|nr:isochorismatase [Anaerolineae bacterium]